MHDCKTSTALGWRDRLVSGGLLASQPRSMMSSKLSSTRCVSKTKVKMDRGYGPLSSVCSFKRERKKRRKERREGGRKLVLHSENGTPSLPLLFLSLY